MNVSYAAFGLVYRPVLHPGKSALELVVVGSAGTDELVRAGKILHGLEILRNAAGSGVEHASFDAVRPGCVAGCHKEVSHSPAVVGDVAGFVACKRVLSGKIFGA